MISVAEAAPATAITTVPTYLRRSLRQFANGSRPPTPEGSGPACAWGDVATPVRSITDRPSLAPSSSTRSPIGSPCGSLSLAGGLRAYHVSPMYQSGLGRVSTPVIHHLRGRSSEPHHLTTYHFGPGLSASYWPVLCDDACDASPGLTLPPFLVPDHLDAGSRHRASRSGDLERSSQNSCCPRRYGQGRPTAPCLGESNRGYVNGSFTPPRYQGRMSRLDTAGRTAGAVSPFHGQQHSYIGDIVSHPNAKLSSRLTRARQ
jgi:hypothetical protein